MAHSCLGIDVRRRRTTLVILVASFCFLRLVPLSAAQENLHSGTTLRGIPAGLRSSLVDGIQQFVAAQRDGNWDQVAVLMGEFRGQSSGKRYTKAHKECLIEQMKSKPMVSFFPTGAGFSTEILSRPLSEKWWYIKGIAEFASDGGKVERETLITAYRLEGRWFFTPPNYDEEWQARKITDADLATDLSSYMKVEIAPNCPLQLVRLSVKMNPKSRSLRRLTFDLRNNSKKEVDGLGFRIASASGDGWMSSGMPFQMAPGEIVSSPDNITYSGYAYYCEGESSKLFIIDWVSFKDGSTWRLKRSRAKRVR